MSVIVLTGLHDAEKRDRAMKLGAKWMVLKEHGLISPSQETR
ncbi:MAG TPA: hypothetical protein VE713_07915 [Pyrinomonadaceae bacterium]|nr:hypothetical protein [Pyrinomonadaceae bacterium]